MSFSVLRVAPKYSSVRLHAQILPLRNSIKSVQLRHAVYVTPIETFSLWIEISEVVTRSWYVTEQW